VVFLKCSKSLKHLLAHEIRINCSILDVAHIRTLFMTSNMHELPNKFSAAKFEPHIHTPHIMLHLSLITYVCHFHHYSRADKPQDE